MKLLDVIDSTQLCPDCTTIRTTRSRHCNVCGSCVERFDHHCPWINNCIGLKNHNFFIVYLYMQQLVLLISFCESLSVFIVYFTNKEALRVSSNQIFTLYSWAYKDEIFLPLILLILAITLLFIGPLALLIFVQTKNFCKG